jgi:hypothetical protein
LIIQDFNLGHSISRKNIQEMITWKPRRWKLSDGWEALHEPKGQAKDWSILLPFCETFEKAFETMCLVSNNGLRKVKDDRGQIFLKDNSQEALGKVKSWLELIGNYVTIRDCLTLSFALDYDKENGDPQKPQTRIGELRTHAKPYDRNPTADTYPAANELSEACLDFLEKMTCYNPATCVVGMPSSKPEKTFDLPAYLAANIAKGLDKPDLTPLVKTIKERPQLKDEPIEKKLESIEGTVSISSRTLENQIVLLVDDLYQSGVSTNYVAMLLLEAGAKEVFGLACEKTCRNDDNVARSSIK